MGSVPRSGGRARWAAHRRVPPGRALERDTVRRGGDAEFVLRRPSAGETADAAHDVLREYRVMSALADTDVPVPTTVAACEDHDVGTVGRRGVLDAVDLSLGAALREARPVVLYAVSCFSRVA
ncbi:phosphotransferase [Halomarina halobia]|uniref:Phosphotransferase n=1 Tax=Halomarina halobia TaxID=3033386 RepID=A0ABD6ACJ0_9EURY